MGANDESEVGKTSRKYVREENPSPSGLIEESEQKHTEITNPSLLSLHGYRFYADPGVFNPLLAGTSDLLASHLHVPAGAVVLDLGTGTGLQALVASGRAKTVLAIDQQSEAVACTRNNVALNGLQAKIEVRQGDLFAAVHTGETFDVIVFNIPYVPWKPETPWQAANFDEGHQLLRRFLTQAKRYLRPGGHVVMTWSDIGDTAYLHTLLEEQGYAYKVLVERQARDIGFYIYELRAFGEG